MLKLVSPRPPARARQPGHRNRARDEVRLLQQRIEEGRAAGRSAQRAVARGRHTIVDAHCGVQHAASGSTPSDKNPAPVADHTAHLAELASRIEEIHQRLLSFSTSIELEMDHLDVVSAEIEQITN